MLGEIQLTIISKRMPKDLLQTSLYLFLTYDRYLQADLLVTTFSFNDLLVFRRQINVLSESVSGTGILSGVAGSCPVEKIRLFYKNPKLFAV